MARQKKTYPQIPKNVWWQVRSIFQQSPNVTLTSSVLASQLSVQESAAKVYLKQFEILGLVDEKGKATELAKRWRMDDSYESTRQQILEHVYPKELTDLQPPNSANLDQVTNWFELEGLGSGSARNRASTYVLVANTSVDDGAEPTKKSKKTVKSPKGGATQSKKKGKETEEKKSEDPIPDFPELNVNIQIHISADATNDQIDQIFSSMRKHLRS